MAIDYWQRYRLQHDPFTAEKNIAHPFVSSTWQKVFDLLIHLSHTSNVLLLVTGHEGIGKSTLLQQFTDQAAATVGVCNMQGDKSIEPDVLRYLLAKHLGINVDNGGIEYFKEQLLQRCQKMQQGGKKYFLVIDDAHYLPERTINTILDVLAYLQSFMENLPLHIILFGCPALEATVSDITQQQFNEQMSHTLRIKPLTKDDVQGYLVARLKEAGLKSTLPFTDDDIGNIYERSEGIPAKINYFARRTLEKKLQTGRKNNKTTKQHRRVNIVLTSTMMVTAALVVGFLVIRHDVEPIWVERAVEMPTDFALVEQDWLVAEPAEQPLALASQTLPQQPSAQAVTVPEVAPEVALVQAPVELPVQVAQVAEKAVVEPVAEPQKIVAEVATVQQVAEVHTKTVEKQHIKSADKAYTLQLVASSSQVRAKQFVKENHLAESHIISTTRHGKPWYVVLYGGYDTEQQARHAIHTLPKVVQSQKPWTRKTSEFDANHAIG
jgi:type II secretory pathway predicted ATPase ExeA